MNPNFEVESATVPTRNGRHGGLSYSDACVWGSKGLAAIIEREEYDFYYFLPFANYCGYS